MQLHAITLVAILFASPVFARTFYVDPQTGNNAADGTNKATPWKNVPGTMNAAATAYWPDNGGVWHATGGDITLNGGSANTIGCGDVIFLKGGPSVGVENVHTVSSGGAICIAQGAPGCSASGTYWQTNCSANNPLTIRVATNSDWPGSLGPFNYNFAGAKTARSAFNGFDFSGGITASKVFAVHIEGASASQYLRVTNAADTSGATHAFGIHLDGNSSGHDVGFVQLDHEGQGGLSMGVVQNVLVHDAVIFSNNGPALNCGLAVNHPCVNSAWVRINAYDNGLGAGGERPFFCAALYIQGPTSIYVIDSFIHDNWCDGMNIGAGNHRYDVPNHTIVRGTKIVHNGLLSSSGSAQAGAEGGGDDTPDERGAPLTGWRPDGCGWPTAAQGACPTCQQGTFCNAGDTGCGLGCSIYDTYGVYEYDIAFGNMGPGFFAHHGSGHSWYINVLDIFNEVRGLGDGQFKDDEVAADHGIWNSIIVNRATDRLFGEGSNALHPICNQTCPLGGKPCLADADCGTCASTTRHACDVYDPMMAVRNSILAPQIADSEALSAHHFRCDGSCSNAGADCSDSSVTCANCTGNAGGCKWENTGFSFANPPKWLSDPNFHNKIGHANDPQFVNILAANCQNGTDVNACNFVLQNSSPAIDIGTFTMLATNSGLAQRQIAVTGNLHSRGPINFNGQADIPSTFFLAPGSYPGWGGDTLRIQDGSCVNDIADFGEAGTFKIASFDNTSITADRNCTWTSGKGLALFYHGSLPDAGPNENGTAIATTTTTSIPTTSSTSTSTSSTTSSTFLGQTTSTSSSTSSSTSTSSTTSTVTTSTLPAGIGQRRYQGTGMRGTRG